MKISVNLPGSISTEGRKIVISVAHVALCYSILLDLE